MAHKFVDCRTLLKTLVLGLKNIVWGITNCGTNYPRAVGVPGNPNPGTKMNVEESLIFLRYYYYYYNNCNICVDINMFIKGFWKMVWSVLQYSLVAQLILICPKKKKRYHYNIKRYFPIVWLIIIQTLEHFASVYTMVQPHIFMDVYRLVNLF